MAALLLLGPRVLPEYRDPDAGRLDLISAAMSLVAVLAVVSGPKEAQDLTGGVAVSAVLGGLVVGGLRAPTLRLADPMIDLRLFRDTTNASLATNLAGIFIAVGYFLFVAQYLQLVLALATGGGAVVAAVGGRLHRRWSNLAPWTAPGPPGAGDRRRAGHGGDRPGAHPGRRILGADLAVLAGASLAISLGLAPVFTATTDLIVSSAPA